VALRARTCPTTCDTFGRSSKLTGRRIAARPFRPFSQKPLLVYPDALHPCPAPSSAQPIRIAVPRSRPTAPHSSPVPVRPNRNPALPNAYKPQWAPTRLRCAIRRIPNYASRLSGTRRPFTASTRRDAATKQAAHALAFFHCHSFFASRLPYHPSTYFLSQSLHSPAPQRHQSSAQRNLTPFRPSLLFCV
jgi:hypothetical protein